MGGLDLLLQLGEGIEFNSYVPFYDSTEVLNYINVTCPHCMNGWEGLTKLKLSKKLSVSIKLLGGGVYG